MKKYKSINYYMRLLHRYIGFFVIGLTVIYSLSGIVLIFRDTNFLKSEILVEQKVTSGLKAEELGKTLHKKNLKIIGDDGKIIHFKLKKNDGTYNKTSGLAIYQSTELPFLLKRFEQLHKSSSDGSLYWFTTIYGGLLFFLAISSFWMFKPDSTFFRSGVYVSSAGGVFAIVLLIL